MRPQKDFWIEFLTLGAIELREHRGAGSKTIEIPPKYRALLAYLALARPREGFHARDTVATLFWPELDQEHARSNLRKAVYELRRMLGAETLLTRGKEHIGLDRERFWCDAVELENVLEDGDDPDAALDLYRGELLPGMHLDDSAEFERWLEEERMGIGEGVRTAVRRMADSAEAEGSLAAAARWHRRALKIDPYNEAALRKLMRVRARLGDRAGALKAYDAFTQRLREELDLEPAEETQRIAKEVRTAEADEAPPAAPDPTETPGAPAQARGSPREPVTIHTVEKHVVEQPTGLLAGWPRLLRVATVYGLAAIVVVLLLTTVVNTFLLPPWFARTGIVLAIVGLPITLAIAWTLDPARSGVASESPQKVWYLLPDTPVVRKGVVGLVIALAVTGAWIGWERWALGPPEISASSVAILPFNVRGDESLEYLSEGMASLIATKMGGVEEFKSLDPNAVLKFVRRTGARSIDPGLGQTVAERFGAGLFALGDVVELGDQIHINLSIYESNRREPTTQLSVQGNDDEIPDLVDQLVGMLLASRFGSSQGRVASLAAMTTDSLDALKAYLQGEHAYTRGRFVDAVSAFDRAVTIDSTFALASYKLAISASWIPDFDLARQASEAALRHSSRLSRPHRTLVVAYHALRTSNPAKVDSLLVPYLEVHPEDVEAWYIYGDALFHFNQLFGRSISESTRPFERALALDPDNDGLMIHLMEAAASEGRFDVVDSLLQRVDPGSDIELEWRPLLAFATGTEPDQAQVLEELRSFSEDQLYSAMIYIALYSPGSHGADRVVELFFEPDRSQWLNEKGHLWRIQLQLLNGSWRRFEEEVAALRPFDKDRALKFHALYATLPFLDVSESQVRALLTEVTAWDPAGPAPASSNGAPRVDFGPLYRAYLIGLLSNRLGQREETERQVRRLNAWNGQPTEVDVGRFLARHLEAHLARRSGDTAKALELLSAPAVDLPRLPASERSTSPFIWHPYERFLRAELLFETDRLEEARELYGVLAEGGSWLNLPYAPISEYRSGQIYEQLGERESALLHYSRFVEYWRESDATLRPLVSEARQRIQHLAERQLD